MAFLHISNVRLARVAASVPHTTLENSDYVLFSLAEADKFMANMGVERRIKADQETTTADYILKIAKSLLPI